MDEETRALQERRAFKLSQKTLQASAVLKNDTVEDVSKTKKRTRVLFEDPKKEDASPSPGAGSRVTEEAWFLSFAKDFEKEISDTQD